MTTSELIKRLRDKLAAMQRTETPLTEYEQRVEVEIHDLLFDLEDGRRYNDQFTAILATFLLNNLLPESVYDDARKEVADMILCKAWRNHVDRFLGGVGITWDRLESALPGADLTVVSSRPELGKVTA